MTCGKLASRTFSNSPSDPVPGIPILIKAAAVTVPKPRFHKVVISVEVLYDLVALIARESKPLATLRTKTQLSTR